MDRLPSVCVYFRIKKGGFLQENSENTQKKCRLTAPKTDCIFFELCQKNVTKETIGVIRPDGKV